MKPYKELFCQQGTDEWLEVRKNHITATDSAKIMGKSSWATPMDCYNEKMEDKKTFITPAMQRGMDLEPKARDLLIAKYGINLTPRVFESVKYPYMMASLDAISDDCTTMFEIKAPGIKTMETVLKSVIDETYIIQCQKQMLVMGLDKMVLFYYFNEFLHYEVKVERDEKLIKAIIKSDTAFWNNNILLKTPPEKYGDEYERNTDEEANTLALRLKELIQIESDARTERDAITEQLKLIAKGKSCLFPVAGMKLQIIERKGAIDWKALQAKWEITHAEVETYRKESSSFSKFSEM